MKIMALVLLVVGVLLTGCGSSDSADSAGVMPTNKPVSPEEQQAAQQQMSQDPKAAADAPRGDGK